MTIEEAIEYAAEKLPEDVCIVLCVENKSAFLYALEGFRQHMHQVDPNDRSLGDQIKETTDDLVEKHNEGTDSNME